LAGVSFTGRASVERVAVFIDGMCLRRATESLVALPWNDAAEAVGATLWTAVALMSYLPGMLQP